MQAPWRQSLLLCLCCFGICFVLSGQSSDLEKTSLSEQIAASPEGPERRDLIIKLAFSISIDHPDSAQALLQRITPAILASEDEHQYLDMIYALGSAYRARRQLDSALLLYDEAEALAIKLDRPARLADVLDKVGNTYFEQNDVERGTRFLQQSLAIGKQLPERYNEFKAATNLGQSLSLAGQTDSADYYFNEALNALKNEENADRQRAEVLTNMAGNMKRSGQLERSLEYFQRALRLMKKAGWVLGVSRITREIGVFYFRLGDFSQALEYFHEAHQIVEETQNYNEINTCLEFLFEGYLTLEDYDNALLHLEQAQANWLKLNEEARNAQLSLNEGQVRLLKQEYDRARLAFLDNLAIKRQRGQMIDQEDYWYLGTAYRRLQRLDSAMVYYEKALVAVREGADLATTVDCHLGLGGIHEEWSEQRAALEDYRAAYRIAIDNNFREKEMDASVGLYRVYKSLGDNGASLRFLENSRNLQDSLFNEEKLRDIARVEANFEFEREKQQLTFEREQENVEQARIRRTLWLALAFLGVLLLIGLGYFRSKQRANEKLNLLNEELRTQKQVVEQQKDKLEELDRAKSRFFTNISHEFRTPLTIIRGMADQIESKPDTWAIKGGQMIRQNAQNLLQLVNQILDLQKLEVDSLKLNLVRGEVIQYLNYIFQSFQSYAMGKRVTLHFLSDVEQLTMDYDSEKVLRILSNLLSNAIKFTEEEGNVYLYLAQTDKAEPHLQIRVQDTGIGIPEAQLPYIYDRFYQVETHSASHGGGGTGIGLALTRELVELMDGNIQVSSTVGKGTTFTVDLPIRRSADTPLVEGDVLPADLSLPAASAAPTDLTHTELRIPAPPAEEADRPLLLIVEDNADVVQYLVACLEDQYRYQVARDGQEGIDRAIELVPDLILSDVMMPKKDGYELCKTLKQDGRTSHIPIVLLTAKADLDSRISGLERGADAYLTKPFEQRELMVRLQKLFELRQALQKRYRGPELATPDVSISEKVTRPEDQFMQKLQTVIYDNLGDENFGIAELCRGMASSRTQLHNKIKALTGKSTSIYLRSLRLHRAKALLLTTDLNVTEIAYEVGFRDPKYFSRTFAEEFGKSPSKMRG
ncbi:MAG: ATP-binding protein [Bacteroidota bacterium]